MRRGGYKVIEFEEGCERQRRLNYVTPIQTSKVHTLGSASKVKERTSKHSRESFHMVTRHWPVWRFPNKQSCSGALTMLDLWLSAKIKAPVKRK